MSGFEKRALSNRAWWVLCVDPLTGPDDYEPPKDLETLRMIYKDAVFFRVGALVETISKAIQGLRR
jgi:hypothetical protein